MSRKGAPAPPPIVLLLRPFQEFAANKTSGGILLLVCTALALAWANSPWSASYTALWHTEVSARVGEWGFHRELHFWVNDVLMALFFLSVGLEIKREILVGELASPRQAALPIVAALGGVIAPALLYHLVNAGGPGARGWGIPMATDIAFALGVMTVLGDRVPLGLKVFLTALAIVDDIAAVAVIAMFYTSEIAWGSLGLAGLCLLALFVGNRMGARHPLFYALLGVLLWIAVMQSGVHPTIAGVALAFTIPARTPLDAQQFLKRGRAVLQHFEKAATEEEEQTAVEALEDACEKVQTPLHRMERALHFWVTFVIMPIFALANAGVAISGDMMANLSQPVMSGVIVGLLLGKPIGITLASWLAVRMRIASLPGGVRWAHIHGAGWLGGIGFTMSLFVAGLAFEEERLLTLAKLGILTASLLAGMAGSILLLRVKRSIP